MLQGKDEVRLIFPEGTNMAGAIGKVKKAVAVVSGQEGRMLTVTDESKWAMLRKIFTPKFVLWLRQNERIAVDTSWQHIGINEVVKAIEERLFHSGITDFSIGNVRDAEGRAFPGHKVIRLGDKKAVMIFKGGWEYFYRYIGGYDSFKDVQRAKRVLEPFFESAKVQRVR